jgi:hypothetical protein
MMKLVNLVSHPSDERKPEPLRVAIRRLRGLNRHFNASNQSPWPLTKPQGPHRLTEWGIVMPDQSQIRVRTKIEDGQFFAEKVA